ncbi:S8 family serine peptidase [Streptomyces chartreusis]|uniref:S8 family serine peptidase n=1 Tax=Streptomyces chartreusis TaxID=1969 RepID=UPI003821DDC3
MIDLMGVGRGREREAADRISEFVFEETVGSAGRRWPSDVLVDPVNRAIGQPVHYVHPLNSESTAEPFSFTPEHEQYVEMLGVSSEWTAEQGAPCVAVLDGGFSWAQYIGDEHYDGCGCVERTVELVDYASIAAAARTHGTLVSLLILSVCPSARIVPIQVFGDPNISGGRAATEWTLMSALRHALDIGADVINISMGFGLDDYECPHCGTLSQACRSAVLELLVAEAVRSTRNGPVVVSAAGNDGIGILNFPARYDSSVAVSSVNSLGEPSSFTNFDATQGHPWLLAAPGGDGRRTSNEWLAESGDHRYRGTSFAAGYVSGLISHALSVRPSTPTDALNSLAIAADSSVSKYDAKYHGRGVIRTAAA